MDRSKIALTAVLLLLLLTRIDAAQFSQDANTICSETIGTSMFGNIPMTSQQALLTITMLIMLTMLLISSAMYMLGRAFNINPLLRFSKDEMREVAITSLIVLVFLGSFSAVSSSAGLGNFLGSIAGTSQTNVFNFDCTKLATASFGMVNSWLYIGEMQVLLNIAASFGVSIQPGGFGPFISPLAGIATLTDSAGVIGIASTFSGVIVIFLFVIAVMLGVFYAMFPLFFYAGVVLRTLPWTRAAGGAFLGLFIAFYFVFPFLLYFFMSPYSQTVLSQTLPSMPNIGNEFSGSDPFSALSSTTSALAASSPLLTFFARGVAEPSVFMLIAIVFSLIISLDFMEALGDMLGSPALSQRNALRGLI